MLVLAFGSSLSIIREDPYDEGIDGTLLKLVYEVLDVGNSNYSNLSELSRYLQFCFVIGVVVVMLNVLIAQLSMSFDKVMSSARPSMVRPSKVGVK